MAGRGLMIAGGFLKGLGTGVASVGMKLREESMRRFEQEQATLRAREQNQTQIQTTEMREEGDTARTEKTIQGQKDVAVIREAGDNTRTERTIQGQKDVAAMREAGDNARTEKTIAATKENTDKQLGSERTRQGLSSRFRAEDGRVMMIEPGTNIAKEVVDEKGNPVKMAATGAESASGDRLWKRVVKAAETTDESTGVKTVDWDKAAAVLRESGSEDLARQAEMIGKGNYKTPEDIIRDRSLSEEQAAELMKRLFPDWEE